MPAPTTTAAVTATAKPAMPATLRRHLTGWGAFPTSDELLVVASARNAEPGWDGRPQLPDWLRPFGGQALVAFDEHGDYLAGVGIKRHDELGHEISVGTEPQARGGLARRLVAQAARPILDQGRIPTYLHTFDNLVSSRVAAAAGFPDRGWSALMLSDEPATLAAASSRVAADVAA